MLSANSATATVFSTNLRSRCLEKSRFHAPCSYRSNRRVACQPGYSTHPRFVGLKGSGRQRLSDSLRSRAEHPAPDLNHPLILARESSGNRIRRLRLSRPSRISYTVRNTVHEKHVQSSYATTRIFQKRNAPPPFLSRYATRLHVVALGCPKALRFLDEILDTIHKPFVRDDNCLTELILSNKIHGKDHGAGTSTRTGQTPVANRRRDMFCGIHVETFATLFDSML